MILEELLGDLGLQINDKSDVRFFCNCSRERVEKVLISLGKKELSDMIQEGKPIELNCHFCSRKYQFTTEDMKKLI